MKSFLCVIFFIVTGNLLNGQITFNQQFENKVILKKDGLSKTLNSFKAMYPFLDYLRKAIG